MNTKIRELEDNILAVINASDTPIEAKRLIVANIYNSLEKEADKVIRFEVRASKKEEVNDGGLSEN